MNLQRYKNSTRRDEKSRVVQDIARTLQKEAGARFLKSMGNEKFLVLDEKQVRDKVGHALRDMLKQSKSQHDSVRSMSL